MNEERCPYCLAPMTTEPTPLRDRLTNRQWIIYKAILQAGPDGYPVTALLEKLPEGRKPGTLRTCIFGINKLIKPLKLDGRGGRYFLERNGE